MAAQPNDASCVSVAGALPRAKRIADVVHELDSTLERVALGGRRLATDNGTTLKVVEIAVQAAEDVRVHDVAPLVRAETVVAWHPRPVSVLREGPGCEREIVRCRAMPACLGKAGRG